VDDYKDYDPRDYPPAAVTVDLVVLTIRDPDDGGGRGTRGASASGDAAAGGLAALTVTRGEEPYKGVRALPGGFVRPDEDLAEAAARELHEETGLRPGTVHLEQLASYGAPGRDPRMRVFTVAYLALAPVTEDLRAGTDAADASWLPAGGRESLAFDHDRILADGVERARAKLEYTPLAAAFCPPEFTIAQLRRVYEIVWGVRLDPRNFHRKVTGTPGFVTPAEGAPAVRERGRPAQLYRRGGASTLYPPLLRPAAAPVPDGAENT
jgi:8-oxo-dGTP diphosphatase